MEIENTSPKPLPVLDPEEIRVLGALMEKSKTTPEYYPMTLNGLTTACNQKSSRNPVVNYTEETVSLILDRLKRKSMAATVTGGSSRVVKYRHTIALNYQFTPNEIAVLCLLFLRGPLTPGEINSNSSRMYEFDDLVEVQNVLEKLATAETPFVKQLPRQSGQKEARYFHLFGDESLVNSCVVESVETKGAPSQLEERVQKLEQELAELKSKFEDFLKEWNS
ncbi:MAG: DUF480 domain-containing protein [Chitinophagaceae bacterium]|nr:MAG: DUF480 domain-containing protein [Chitinophagaceae bacterium]